MIVDIMFGFVMGFAWASVLAFFIWEHFVGRKLREEIYKLWEVAKKLEKKKELKKE